jgi:hypothetical protein
LGRAATLGYAAYETARIYQQYNSVSQSMRFDQPLEQYASNEGLLQSLRSIPVAGAVGEALANRFSSNYASDNAYARDAIAASGRQDRASEWLARRGAIRLGQREEAFSLGLGGENSGIAALRTTQRRLSLLGIDADPSLRAALGGEAGRLAGAVNDSFGARSGGIAASGLNSMAIHATMAGNGGLGFSIGQSAERAALLSDNQGRLAGTTGQERQIVTVENAARVTELETRQAKESADRKRQIARDEQGTQDAIAISGLEKSKSFYAADLMAFEAMTRQKLMAITDLDEKQRESQRRTAQRDVLIGQSTQAINSTNTWLAHAGNIAELQAGHQNDAAALEAFDEQTRTLREKQDESTLTAFDISRSRQRGALVARQNESRGIQTGRLDTRQTQAKLRARGRGRLADLAGTLQGYGEETQLADPSMRRAIRATQEVELQGQLQYLQRPHAYAQLYDQSTGQGIGPDRDAGKETNELLMKILEALAVMNKQDRMDTN